MGRHIGVIGLMFLLGFTLALEDRCLVQQDHKKIPSMEADMKECLTYANSSCCYSNFTENLISTWSYCGNFSAGCAKFMKKIECFYQCSPHAAHWMNPNYTAGILNVPVCASFCDGWFEACKEDLTCARNWLTDFKWEEHVQHCQQECVPFSKMYGNGTDLCQSMWGSSFAVSSSKCGCLQMDEQDGKVVTHLLQDDPQKPALQDC